MSLPEIVQSTLDGESVAARVGLGGDDLLLVTPTRTLVYRAEGLLSDEAVEEFPHDAEHVGVSEGRRKAKITLDYGLDGERTFSVPTKQLDQVLHPVLAGVFNARGITDPGETVKQTYRFSELTIVITSARLVRHIGAAVWDEEYEEYHFGDVTDLDFEEGSVATSVVITVDGHQERFKTPNDQARAVREGLVSAVCAYHNVDDLEELRAAMAEDEDDDESVPDTEDGDTVSFGDGPDPLDTSGVDGDVEETDEGMTTDTDRTAGDTATAETASTERDEGFGGSGFQSAGVVDDDAVARELSELRKQVEAQNERLERQERTIRQLIEELRQGR
ncbi:DUF7115 domain-containing protein [Haloplanus aerogenes]|uniref:DUF7115 domain-containing protein n=1 Tax=Haloplanus aerogenes TaxID=660522 RepID=A0A3M0CYJ4_9EURY|nr:hypothetical protein [Haloplanus aerogenes]AZH26501.1 hypothetical protein DU502_14475 [Haloplanus aerogenes]RMB12729.1 hypothetical protein ATH50_2880 [Haloplanus aerogenes]